MSSITVKISDKGQIVIPKKIRDKIKTRNMEMEFVKNQIILKPVPSLLELAGSLSDDSAKKQKITIKEMKDQAWEEHVKEKFGHS
jgi:AbrB family looped-hinge helix DNA binding protein